MTGEEGENKTTHPVQARGFPARVARLETVILAVAWVGTFAAKARSVRLQFSEDKPIELLRAAAADAEFVALIAFLLAFIAWRRPTRFAARTALAVSSIVAFWAVLNAWWLVSTGAQIQPSVLVAAGRNLAETKLILAGAVEKALPRAIPALVLVCGFGLVIVARFVWPRPFSSIDACRRRRVVVCLMVFAVASIMRLAAGVFGPAPTVWGEAIGFSAHAYALRSMAPALRRGRAAEAVRSLPAAGERNLQPPPPDKPRWNVVVIMLESVSRASTSLAREGEGAPPISPTPVLERLAAEGWDFAQTHAPVSHTTDAVWASFTGMTPDLYADAVESALVDEPYEGLPTVLRREGYRSAFFQLSPGTWEGGPALMANLGFDWAYFRENLEDRSAHLGYWSGDDFRLIDPMMNWIEAEGEPFLLSMITSFAHSPYELPEWAGVDPGPNAQARHGQAVTLTDQFVGAVVDALTERDLLERTIVCVIADHGEVFRPESRHARWVAYEEAVRVPWIMRVPGVADAGRRFDGPCSQLDVTPTILAALGWSLGDAGFEGYVATGPVPDDRRVFLSSWFSGSPIGYVEGSRKVVFLPNTGRVLAFDLAADPLEQHPMDVTGTERDEVIRVLDGWIEASRIDMPPGRFRTALLFDHWRVMSTGRGTSASYVRTVPDPADGNGGGDRVAPSVP